MALCSFIGTPPESVPEVCCANCNHYNSATNTCCARDGTELKVYNAFIPRLYCKDYFVQRKPAQKETRSMTSRYLSIQVDIVEEIRKLIIDNINFNPADWSERDADIFKLAAEAIMHNKNKPIPDKKRALMVLTEKEMAYE